MQTAYWTLPGKGIGLKAAVISDVHNRNHDAIWDALQHTSPDLVLIPGDLMECQNDRNRRYVPNPKYPNEPGLTLLTEIAKRYPVFYSPGNHENTVDDKHRAAIEATGAVLLTDDFVRCNGYTVGGLASPFENGGQFFTPAPNEAFLQTFSALPGYKILLSHHPELYDRYIRHLGIDAVVSGHAHGGQWRLGRLAAFAPGQGIFPKYTKGIYHDHLIVSPGTANHCRVPRIFNPPMLVVVTLGTKD